MPENKQLLILGDNIFTNYKIQAENLFFQIFLVGNEIFFVIAR
jgi:hypothetical protein